MDQIGNLLIQFATLTGAVWAAVEFLPRAIRPLRRLTRELLAIVFGPASGVLAVSLGWIVLPGDPSGWRLYVGGAFAGLLATITAGAAHDYLIKPAAGGKV